MKKRRNKNNIFIAIISFVLIISILLFSLFLKIRPLLLTSAKNTAKTIMLNATNTAVVNIIDKYDICYDKISSYLFQVIFMTIRLAESRDIPGMSAL